MNFFQGHKKRVKLKPVISKKTPVDSSQEVRRKKKKKKDMEENEVRVSDKFDLVYKRQVPERIRTRRVPPTNDNDNDGMTNPFLGKKSSLLGNGKCRNRNIVEEGSYGVYRWCLWDKGKKGVTITRFGVICRRPMNCKVFRGLKCLLGEVRTIFCGVVKIDKEKAELVMTFCDLMFETVMNFRKDINYRRKISVIPLGNQDEVDWSLLKKIKNSSTCQERKIEDVRKGDFILKLNNKADPLLFVVGGYSNLTPSSTMKELRKKGKDETYFGYFLKKYDSLGESDINQSQKLLRLQHFPKRCGVVSLFVENQEERVFRQPIFVIKELCKLVFPEEINSDFCVDFLKCLPLVVEFNSNLKVSVVCDEVLKLVCHDSIEFGLIREALSLRTSGDRDYQVLEFFGDAFLSYWVKTLLGLLTLSDETMDLEIINKFVRLHVSNKMFSELMRNCNFDFVNGVLRQGPKSICKNFEILGYRKSKKRGAKAKIVLSDILESLVGALFLIDSRRVNGDRKELRYDVFNKNLLTLQFIHYLRHPLTMFKHNDILVKDMTKRSILIEKDNSLHQKVYTERNLEGLERILGYNFQRKKFLVEALTVSNTFIELPSDWNGHVDKKSLRNYEKLEFLGDAIVNFIIVEELYHRIPTETKISELTEAWLTTRKQCLISNKFFRQYVLKKNIQNFIIGKYSGTKSKVLADVYESLIGAVFISSAFSFMECKSVVSDYILGHRKEFEYTSIYQNGSKSLEESDTGVELLEKAVSYFREKEMNICLKVSSTQGFFLIDGAVRCKVEGKNENEVRRILGKQIQELIKTRTNK